MTKYAKDLMKDAICQLLNLHLKQRGLSDIQVVDVTDDYEQAQIAQQGASVLVSVNSILIEESPNEEPQRPINRGANADEVERIRSQRIDGVKQGRIQPFPVRSGVDSPNSGQKPL